MTESKSFIFYSDKLEFKEKNGEFFAEGYISTSDPDLVNDIVTSDCMDDMMSQMETRTLKLDFEHEAFKGENEQDAEYSKTRLPLGKSVSHRRDSIGLWVRWKLNDIWKKLDSDGKVVMTFKEIWKSCKEGYYDAFSIAYIPTRTKQVERAGVNIRLLDRLNLFNVALTGNPVNPGASMTAVMAKSLEFMKEVKQMTDNELTASGAPAGGQATPDPDKKSVEDQFAEVKAALTGATEKISGLETANKELKALIEAKPGEKLPEEKSVEDQFGDVKIALKDMTEKLTSLENENKELKDIVEMARPKGTGASNKAETKGGETPEFKSIGPLDLI